MVSGIFLILPEVYVDNSSAAISRAAPSPMMPHAAIRNMPARFTLPWPPSPDRILHRLTAKQTGLTLTADAEALTH